MTVIGHYKQNFLITSIYHVGVCYYSTFSRLSCLLINYNKCRCQNKLIDLSKILFRQKRSYSCYKR